MSELNKTLLNPKQLPATALFGTDGIRGRAGDLLNAPFTLELGYWAGRVLEQTADKKGPIIIGQDSRNSSDMLAAAIAAGLTSAGLEVWNLGLCPTPCVANLASKSAAIGGIMISASHNPPPDNGIKFFGSKGTKLSDILTHKIEGHLRHDRIEQNTSVAWGKTYQRSELVEQYVSSLKAALPKATSFRGMRIVLDLAWGAAVKVAPAVFEQLGAEVISLHHLANGDRINVGCGSTHLELLKQGVQDYQADLGFAFDGDADRVMAVDSRGRAIDGDYILYLWGDLLRQRRQLPDNLIVATVMANLGFERAWQAKGGKMQRTKVGDRHVQAAMWRTGAMLGGEQSGHILCHHHGVSGDGIQTALHLTSLVKQSEASLCELIDNSFTTYPQILRNVRVEDRDRRSKWQECAPVQQEIARAEAAMGEQGRILVRASGTEPLIRVMVEAADSQLTEYWTDKLVRVVEQNLAA